MHDSSTMNPNFANNPTNTTVEGRPLFPQFFDILKVIMRKIRENRATETEQSQLVNVLCDEQRVYCRAIASYYHPELQFFSMPLQTKYDDWYSPQMRRFKSSLYSTFMKPADYTVTSYLGSCEKNTKAFRLIDFTARKLRYCEATQDEITGLVALICTNQTETFRAYAEIAILELTASNFDLCITEASPQMLGFLSEAFIRGYPVEIYLENIQSL